jgi:predicted PurR-regulated permease PerM
MRVRQTPMDENRVAAGPPSDHSLPDASPVDPASPAPSQNTLSIAVIGLFLLAIVYTLYLAQAILMPIAVAALFALLLSPLMRVLGRLRVPRLLGAAVVVGGLIMGAIAGIGVLAEPAAIWTAEMPKVSKQLEKKFRQLREPIDHMRQATQQVEKMTTLESPQDVPQTVVIAEGGLFARTVGVLQSVGTTLGIVFGLLFFLLATGDTVRTTVQQALPEGRGRQTVIIFRDVQRNLSAYLATITLINIGLGIVTGFALYLLGMPNALLWGTMATMLNFVPLVGAVIGCAVIAVVGMISFSSMIDGLLPPLVYIGLHLIESQLVTPYVIGRRLTMNPVAVFLSIVLWTWLWGIPGALMAVPLLAMLKVVCDAFDGLRPLGRFIGDDAGPEKKAADPAISAPAAPAKARGA